MEKARPLLFHRQNCSRSRRAVYYLRTRAVGHDEIEVTDDSPSLEQLRSLTQQEETPAFVFEQNFIHGFDVAELAAFLRKYHLDATAPR